MKKIAGRKNKIKNKIQLIKLTCMITNEEFW